jgi:short-subunit dehydrogenase
MNQQTRKLAAITGASAGLGASFARKLAARGYDLLLIARREDRLKALASELNRIHADILVADLSRDDDIERVSARLRTEPNLALLVNNAGFGSYGFFWETDVANQEKMHRLHVLATVRLTHAALANMTARDTGAVINVASVAGFGQAQQNVSYCSTKAWMIHFTQGLAIELAAKKSHTGVQALCPGFVLTEFHDVLGMDRTAVPASMWMPADFVVEDSLNALATKKVVVVPGWRYKLIVTGMKLIPQSTAARITRRLRKPKARPDTST